MKKLKLDLEYCYGIKKMSHEFDFSNRNICSIYAPNGSMKTSFSKTFKDLSKGEKTIDRIQGDKVKTIAKIVDENGTCLKSDQVFVIESFDKEFISEKVSSLLVNKNLKTKYDKLYQSINEKKDGLLGELKKLSGLKMDDIETAISLDVTGEASNVFVALKKLQKNIENDEYLEWHKLSYAKIFDEKAEELLRDSEFQKNLFNYMKIYEDLTSKSSFFKKGFNHNNADDTAKNLSANGFFGAQHAVILSDGQTVKTAKEMQRIIDSEKQKILNDPTLAASFEVIDDKLKRTKQLKAFRDYVLENKDVLLTELVDIRTLKIKLWCAYLANKKELYQELIHEYDSGKIEIEQIVKSAKKEVTKWQSVLDDFNRRFSVPFKVVMRNQEDVILKSEAPSIKFDFSDDSVVDPVEVKREDLWLILSQGEKRALYILNIIFEVEARKLRGEETLFIVDDIADSFDYKNKYAIIEYLIEISKEKIFYQIVLTHNFDFFRNINSRLGLSNEGSKAQKLHVTKNKNEITFVKEKYSRDPFRLWKEKCGNDDAMLISMIPFMRTLAEYGSFDSESSQLEDLLHIKKGTRTITVGDLGRLINTLLPKVKVCLNNSDVIVIDLIFKVANQICEENDETIELEQKIVLSIAIRLQLEIFLIKEINDEKWVSAIKGYQTRELIERYKKVYSEKIEAIKIADRVNLMTPENIHINSFMYEPILDMSNEHLKQLYKNVCNLFTDKESQELLQVPG